MFPLKTVAYKSAYFLGKSEMSQENKGNFIFASASPQGYPQIPWTSFSLPPPPDHCSAGEGIESLKKLVNIQLISR